MFDYYCTVGIPASNEEFTILNLLIDILGDLNLSNEKWQIIIVVNGCEDHTLDKLIAFGFSYANYLEENVSDEYWISFTKDQLLLTVYTIPFKSKSKSLNIIHEHAKSEVIILLDADIRLSKSTLPILAQTLKSNAAYALITPRYQGVISPFSKNEGWKYYLRYLACRTINQFDTYLPRLDGKAFAYLKSLIDEHINIIPVDTWIEGIAWIESQGCIYLQQPTVFYQFPATFDELSRQYARYLISLQLFKKSYPVLYKTISKGRRVARDGWNGRARILDRAIGWIFFRWVSIYIKILKIQINIGDATWDAIQTTKKPFL